MEAALRRLGTVPDDMVARDACSIDRLLAYEGTLEPRRLVAEALRTEIEEPPRPEAPAEESALAEDFGYEEAPRLEERPPAPWIELDERDPRVEAAWRDEFLVVSCMPEGVKILRADELEVVLADPRVQGAL